MSHPPINYSRPDKSTERSFDPRVWLLAIGTFAIGTDANVISGILPQLAAELGVRVSTAGQVVSLRSCRADPCGRHGEI